MKLRNVISIETAKSEFPQVLPEYIVDFGFVNNYCIQM